MKDCKHTLEISIPVEEVKKETERVVAQLSKKVRLPGFRPGKAPAGMIHSRFQEEIRQDVLESLVPRFFHKRVEDDNLRVVGQPNIVEVHFQRDEPLRFKAEFETAPEVELGEYRDVTVTYREPEVTDEDVTRRIEELRQQKAEYVNVDPRPLAAGDFAVVAMKSVAGLEGDPIQQDELTIEIGGGQTLAGFNENLFGMSPGEEKEFDVAYPDNHSQERFAGRTIRFHVEMKAVRRKELPEINDDFAQDLGDYKNIEELCEAVRTSLRGEREFLAQREAKNELIEKLIDSHDFPVPDVFVQRQIEANVEQQVHELIAQGVNPKGLKLDWEEIRRTQQERAVRDVKASLLLERIAEREAIETTGDEVDREVARIARHEREPVAAARARLQKEGALARIVSRIRTEKTLDFLFEQARKVAPEQGDPSPST